MDEQEITTQPLQTQPAAHEEPTTPGSLASIFVIIAIIIGGGFYYLFLR